MEARTSGLAEMLDSGDPSQLAQACDELAESCQAELGLSDVVRARLAFYSAVAYSAPAPPPPPPPPLLLLLLARPPVPALPWLFC